MDNATSKEPKPQPSIVKVSPQHIKMNVDRRQQRRVLSSTLISPVFLVILTSSTLLALNGVSAGRIKRTYALSQEPVNPIDEGDVEVDEGAGNQAMPESIYKNAPLLFGASIASDYYNEQPATKPKQAPQQAPKTSGAKQPAKSSKSTAVKQTETGFAKARKSATSTRSVAAKVAAISPEMSASALKDMAKSGVSMDHVLSSLGLVVEAMKQQTMAMQMISGQMMAVKEKESGASAASKAPASEPLDTKSLLESFGEIMGGFRGARSAPTVKTVTDTFGDPVKAGVTSPDEPLIISQQPVNEPTTSSTTQRPTAAPTTTTTTTTTTPKPTTTSTTTTTTTTTTTSAPPTTRAPETTTTPTIYTPKTTQDDLIRYKIMPQPAPPSSAGWRRVVPFDFYPYQGSSDTVLEPTQKPTQSPHLDSPSMMMMMMNSNKEEKAGEQKALSASYPMFGQPASQLMESLPASAPMEHNFKSVGMPQYGAPQVMRKPADLVSMIQKQQMLAAKSHKLPQYSMQAALEQPNQMSQQMATLMQMMPVGSTHESSADMSMQSGAVSTPAPLAQHMKLIMSMIAAEEQQQQQQQDQDSKQVQMMSSGQQMNLLDGMSSSDEIPKPPTIHERLPPVGLKGAKQALKIGDRPQFDLANFQLLMSAKGAAKTPDSPVEEAKKLAADLNENASSQESEWAASKPAATMLEESKPTRAGQKSVANPQAPKQTSFSILGGRFKITPHTQMLDYILAPSKHLFQHALGHIISGGPNYAPPPPSRQALRPRRAQVRPSKASNAKGAQSSSKSRLVGAKSFAKSQSGQKSSSSSSQTSSSSSSSIKH